VADVVENHVGGAVAGSHSEGGSQNQMSGGACLEWEVARYLVKWRSAVGKATGSNERSRYLKGCRPLA
jgi:hypothetical protein